MFGTAAHKTVSSIAHATLDNDVMAASDWRTWWKRKHQHTWMKNSLGFPTSDLQRSPRKSDVRYLSSMELSVPNNTPSSPWLSRTQTKEAQRLWSSFAAERIRNVWHGRVTMEASSVTSGTGRVPPQAHQRLEAVSSAPLSGRCAPSLCSPGLRTLSWHWQRLNPYRFACSCLQEISKGICYVTLKELQICTCFWEQIQNWQLRLASRIIKLI